jgi:undecaprenyl-diphosphatase
MTLLHAIILGLIQGITEFLPISSSGHLLLVPYLLGWPASGLAFDVALNTGTFLAVIIYFFPVWWRLLVDGLIARKAKELRLLAALLVATIPAALIGFFAQPLIEQSLRKPAITATLLIVFAFVLWWAEKRATLKKDIDAITWRDALIIGLSQALALVPGVSRSGITMTSGLLLGLTKEDTAQFSFLLIAPISFGAAISQYSEVLHAPDLNVIAIGTLISFLVGLVTIHFLLTFIKKYGFAPYIWYRIVIGLLVLGIIAWR